MLIVDEELVVDAADSKVATVLQDEFEHWYTLPD